MTRTPRTGFLQSTAFAPTAVLFVILLVGCDLTDPGPVPDAIEVEPTAITFDALGAQRLLAPRLLDTQGSEIPDPAFEFESSDPGVATVSPGGQVIARGNGSTEIRIRSRGIRGVVPVTIEQSGATLGLLSGRGQTREIGQPLEPIRFQLTDPRGNPAEGIPLIGEVTGGGGWLEADTTLTDAEGRASLTWTLGPEVGPGHTLRVRVAEERSVTAGETAVSVSARAQPGSPSTLELLTPEAITGHRGLSLSEPVRARVLNVFDEPIEGARVRIHIAGRATTTLVSDTDGGIAAEWRLNQSLEPQTLRMQVLDGLDGGQLEREVQVTPFSTPERLAAVTTPASSNPPGTELPPLGVRLLDRAELPMADIELRFEVTSGEGRFIATPDGTGVSAVTDGGGEARSPGFRLPDAPGVTRVDARVPGTEVAVEFVLTAQLPVDRIEVVSGDGQSAIEGQILGEAITVEVLGESGLPLEGVPVRFSAERGGVEFPLVISDEQGRATTRWRLGWGTGPETVWAEADPVVRAITALALPFSEGDPGVHTPRDLDPSTHRIELVFGEAVPVAARPILQAAADRWSRAITGDLPPIFLNLHAGGCANDLPLLGTVDDLMIFVQVEAIDGVGGTAAFAGPCVIRSDGAFPVVGLTVFDEADFDQLMDEGLLHDVALHEFAHALGFGTIWSLKGLLRNPVESSDPSVDTHFSGFAAREAFEAIGGTAYTDGNPVPVENEFGGIGTLNGHWRWNVFGSEVMTGFISPGTSPLSTVTLASFVDLGYQVDLTEADPFSLSFADYLALRRGEPATGHEGGIELGDDLYRGPVLVVGPEGEVLRELRGDPPGTPPRP